MGTVKNNILAAALLASAVSPNLHADLDAAAAAAALGDSGEYHLAMFNGEERDGFMRLGWYHEGDDLVVYDRTMMPSMEIYETYRATMSPADLSPRTVAVRFHQGTATLNIEAQLAPGQVSGTRSVERVGMPADSNEFSLEAPEGTILRAVTFLLPLVIDSEPGQEISYSWFSPLGGQVNNVTLTSENGGEVETPAGTFETTVWKLRGAAPENDIYVTRGEEQRIVRIDVLGQPLKFLAINP